MIVSVTLNPALDQTARVMHVEVGGEHRELVSRLDPAGKGVNVARMAHRLGSPALALGLVAGETGELLRHGLSVEGVPHELISVPGQTRINFTVVDDDGNATRFIGAGPAVPEEAVAELGRRIETWLAPRNTLVLSGSLPPRARQNVYAEFIHAARVRDARVILDADGPALEHGLAAGPDLIKPNLGEAERLLGRSLEDEQAIVVAAREIADQVPTVVISLGARGAICVHGGRTLRVTPPRVQARSSVGAGDAMVAGMAIACERGDRIEAALALGTAAGAATAMAEGTTQGSPAEVAGLLAEVLVEDLL